MQEHYFESTGIGKIHVCRWEPKCKPKAIVQILHGIAEHVKRYDDFARFLNNHDILVVAEDHMGHGESSVQNGIQGYFHGGWFAAVADSVKLLHNTCEEFPDVPYILFGHSMGSFMARTILQEYPDSGIAGCIICGTGFLSDFILQAGRALCATACKFCDETEPSPKLQSIVFAGYNKRVEHPRTDLDWLTRDNRIVDAYIADPKCGFSASAGLLRDMLDGIIHIQRQKNLNKMNKKTPVYFISGADDPVGNYGKGVKKTMDAFRKCGMISVTGKIYPLCRHEILNELNKQEVYEDVLLWIENIVNK